MILWNQVVEVLREAIFAYAQASHGNIGYGIVAVTFLTRLALFPLMVRIALASAAHQEAVARIQPDLDAIKARYKNDPQKRNTETQRIFEREGVSMVPLSGCLGHLAQMPVLIALYSAVRQAAIAGGRFLWIQDISVPNLVLTVIVAALGSAAAAVGAPSAAHNRAMSIVLPSVITLIALSRMAAGVGIYWGVSSLAGVAQGLWIKRQAVGRTP